jgi:hypothetical protein
MFPGGAHSWGGSADEPGNYWIRPKGLECLLIDNPSRRLKVGTKEPLGTVSKRVRGYSTRVSITLKSSGRLHKILSKNPRVRFWPLLLPRVRFWPLLLPNREYTSSGEKASS